MRDVLSSDRRGFPRQELWRGPAKLFGGRATVTILRRVPLCGTCSVQDPLGELALSLSKGETSNLCMEQCQIGEDELIRLANILG